MGALKVTAKVALIILALPFLIFGLRKVLSGAVINTYADYCAWVAGVLR